MKSGLTKETVHETIAILEGMFWLANYDPTDYYPFHQEESEPEQIAIDDNQLGPEVYDLEFDNIWDYSRREEFDIS